MLYGYKFRLGGYVGYITADSKLEEIKSVAIREAGTWEPVPQCCLERSCQSGISFSPMEYKGNEDDLVLWTWYVKS